MILTNLFYTLALAFTPVNSLYDSNYQLSCNISSHGYTDVVVFQTTSNNAAYLENFYEVSCKCSYTQSTTLAYKLQDFKIKVTSYVYVVNAQNIAVLDATVNYTYTPDWVYYQSTSAYDQMFDALNFNSGVNNDDLHLNFYDGDTLLHSESVESDQYSYTPTISYIAWEFDYTQFKNSISSYLNQINGDSAQAYGNGYSVGYNDGLNAGQQMNPEMFAIFNGILNIAMVPVNVFLGIFNFEVFGINIAASVSALLSICILVIVLRMIFGGSNKGD